MATEMMASETKDQKSYALSTVTPKHNDVEEGQITSTLDEAELFLHEHGITHAQLQKMLSDETRSKNLRRRIDCILLPMLCGTYVLQYVDKQVFILTLGMKMGLMKQALSYSAVFDLFDNANITSDQYSWLTSIFYFGMFISQG